GSLVVLVHAHAVEAKLLCVLQLVEVAVVELVAFLSIVVAVAVRHPGGRILLHEVVRQIWPRHQVEEVELHGDSYEPSARRSSTGWRSSSGRSRCGTWPHRSIGTRRAWGMPSSQSLAFSIGMSRSSWPQMISVGAFTRRSRRPRRGLYR